MIIQKKLEDKIKLVGNVENVYEYLSAVDYIVMPSHYEGFPLTLVEEQASGLKCLVSDTITKDTNLTKMVFYFPLNGDKGEWSRIIDGNFGDRSKISNENIKVIKKIGFDIKIQVELLCQYYENLVRK